MGPSRHARRLGRTVSDRTTSTRTTGFRLRRGAVALAGVLALGLSACGDDSGGGTASPSVASEAGGVTPLKAVQAAATTSQEKSTAKFSMEMNMEMDGQKMPMKATGELDSAKSALELDLSMTVPGEGSMKLKQIVIGNTIYMTGIPGMPAKQWVKLSLDELGQAAGGATANLGTGSDPADQLKLLTQVSDDVKEAGKETVNGVETTKYTGSIDLEKAVEASGASAKELAQVKKQYEQLGLKSIPFELYIDEDNLPARMTMTMEGKVASGGETQQMSMDTTMDFTDWGDPVTIKAPKNAVSFEELLSGLGAGLNGTP
jgi:hypothetical protein